jgi:hypothetical protein
MGAIVSRIAKVAPLWTKAPSKPSVTVQMQPHGRFVLAAIVRDVGAISAAIGSDRTICKDGRDLKVVPTLRPRQVSACM